MSKRGENIYRRKDGRYEGRYVIGKNANGTTKFGYVYGKKLADVRRRLIEKKAAQRGLSSPAPSHIRADDWFARWLQCDVAWNVKNSTCQAYRGVVRRHIVPFFEGMPIERIEPQDVQRFLAALRQRGLAPSTQRGIFLILRKGLQAAREEGLLSADPCRRIKLKAPARAEQSCLSLTQQCALIKAAGEDDLPALLSLFTGMRLGELCALRWEHVDFAAHTVTVKGTAQRVSTGGHTALMVDTPKSQSSCRVLPLNDFMLDRLSALHAASDGSGYVFSLAQRPAEPRTMQRRFMRLCERAGVVHTRFHALRHH